MSKPSPSIDAWLREAKADPGAAKIGMYLTHNGVVRRSAKAKVRQGAADTPDVTGMQFSYDAAGVERAVAAAREMEGVFYVRAWLNEGLLTVGDDMMYLLVGADIRPHAIEALEFLLNTIKKTCVTETELYGS